jgi:hypothetical protein
MPKLANGVRVMLAAAIAMLTTLHPALGDGRLAAVTAEDRANQALAVIARRQDEINLAHERLKAALERQVGVPYSTITEAETASAALELVSRLGERNAEILMRYRELFKLSREQAEALVNLKPYCEAAAAEYDGFAAEETVPAFKHGYEATAELWRARASQTIERSKEVISEYDEGTETYLVRADLFLARLRKTLEGYPPVRLDQSMRRLVMEQIKVHIADMDKLADALKKWRDRADEQSIAPDAAKDAPDGAIPQPSAVGPAPLEPAPPAPALNPEEEFRREVENVLRQAQPLSAITATDLPRLAGAYGLGPVEAVPYYSATRLRAGDLHPLGTLRATLRAGWVYLTEGSTARRVVATNAPQDWVLLKPTSLARLGQDAQSLAAARRERGQVHPAAPSAATRLAATRQP